MHSFSVFRSHWILKNVWYQNFHDFYSYKHYSLIYTYIFKFHIRFMWDWITILNISILNIWLIKLGLKTYKI